MRADASPAPLIIQGSSTITLTNILVGDVWLISGQSNADFPLKSAAGGAKAMAAATNTMIRCLHLAALNPQARAWSAEDVRKLNPEESFKGQWEISSPSVAGDISAVGYFFARHIQTNQNMCPSA